MDVVGDSKLCWHEDEHLFVTKLLESVFHMVDVMLNFEATMSQSKLCCDGGDKKKKVRKLFY